MRIRREVKENFTWVHNTFIRDKRLALDEKGLLILMLSLPMSWKFTVSGLAAMVADGKDRISSTLKDLEKHGYLVRKQKFNKNVDGQQKEFDGFSVNVDINTLFERSIQRFRKEDCESFIAIAAGLWKEIIEEVG